MQQTGCLPAAFVIVTIALLVVLGMGLDLRLGIAVGATALMVVAALTVRGLRRLGQP